LKILKKSIEAYSENNQNRDINFLIIDDEGDYGSLDGNAANDKKDGVHKMTWANFEFKKLV
jgi:hypothetical protein